MNSERGASKIREGALGEVLHGICDRINRVDLYRSCITCEHWRGATGEYEAAEKGPDLCGKWNARPPGYVIANGCGHYVDKDEIPF